MALDSNLQSNFKESLKGTSLFGGVQLFQIFISVIRSKILAVFLGPGGVGILGLLQSTLDMIYSISNLGLATSAIRDISEANKEHNIKQLSKTSKVFKNLVLGTGLIGLMICLCFSRYWSYASFGSYDYTFTFIFLSTTVLFRLLSEGQIALLQGTQNLRSMAKANLIGNAYGLLFSFPIYYFMGISGIALSLFVFYLINLLISWYYSRKVAITKVSVSLRETLKEGHKMLKLGIFISLSALMTTLAAYIVRLFISNTGNLHSVGLYTAGFAVVNTYVGMAFTAISKEYFPRISSLSKDNSQFISALNNQIQLNILLIGPLICIFIIFCRIGINILYTKDFLEIDTMMCLAILAILFKTPSWCCSYAIIAKGDSAIFFCGELASLIIMLLSNILLFKYYGLNGLGVAYIILYLYYALQEWFICRLKYGLRIETDIIYTYLPYMILAIVSLLIAFFMEGIYRYIVGCIPIMLSLSLSYIKMNRLINIKAILKNRFK